MADAPFIDRVGVYCRSVLGLDEGARILVAVSGGADSVALVHVLRTLGYTIEVAHFDHRTRGGDSTCDAEFVRDLAARLDVPFHLGSADVPAVTALSGESFEMHARRLRYDFLAQTARRAGIREIATGHHADDQAETMLLRVLRGTSGHGLAGIPPVREDGELRIVRPLLDVTREALLAYLESIGEPYCEDATNDDVQYLRNRVRHELIPALARDYNPQLVSALNRLAETERIEHEYLDLAAAKRASTVITGDTIEREAFAALHDALRRRVFQIYAWHLGVTCGYERILAGCAFVVEGRVGACFDLGLGIVLKNGARTTEVAPDRDAGSGLEIALLVPGTTQAFGRTFCVRNLDAPPNTPLAEYCTPSRQVFDARSTAGLRVRRCRAGDRFVPLGMHGSRKLSDYLGERKLSPSERAAQLLLESNDMIVWVVGRAIGAQAAVTDATRAIVEVEVLDGNRQ